MKYKQYILIIFVIILGLILLSSYIFFTFIYYDKELHYRGAAHVFYKPETNLSTIINISFNENITILSIRNITNEYNEVSYIKVIYYAPKWEDGDNIRKKLEKYDEVSSIALMRIAS